MIRTGTGKDPLLRRPFSIHQTTSKGLIQVYFKVVGRGTEILAQLKKTNKSRYSVPWAMVSALPKPCRPVSSAGGWG
jgi:NAD(P)H-flavin reductase